MKIKSYITQKKKKKNGTIRGSKSKKLVSIGIFPYFHIFMYFNIFTIALFSLKQIEMNKKMNCIL